MRRHGFVPFALLVLVIAAIKISREVLERNTAAVDKGILVFIHSRIPDLFTGFFKAVTLTGSSWVLLPVAGAATIALLAASRLVLGVHRPTDVLAANCIGTTVPLIISVALEFAVRWRTDRRLLTA